MFQPLRPDPFRVCPACLDGRGLPVDVTASHDHKVVRYQCDRCLESWEVSTFNMMNVVLDGPSVAGRPPLAHRH